MILLVANVLNLKSHDLLMEVFVTFFSALSFMSVSNFLLSHSLSALPPFLAPLCKMTNNEVMSGIHCSRIYNECFHTIYNTFRYLCKNRFNFKKVCILKLKTHFISGLVLFSSIDLATQIKRINQKLWTKIENYRVKMVEFIICNNFPIDQLHLHMDT